MGTVRVDLHDGSRQRQFWISPTTGQLSASATNAGMALVFAIPAALIVSRQPRNTLGWLLIFPADVFALAGLADNYLQSVAAAQPTLLFVLAAWFSSWSWVLYIFPLLLIALLFPSGRPPSRRWNWLGAAVVLWAILFILIASFGKFIQPNVGPELPDPLGLFSDEFLIQLIGPWQVGLLLLTILCVSALFVRYRRGTAAEQEQIKWLVFACGVFAVVFIIGGFVLGLGDKPTFASDVFNFVLALTTACIPIAIAIAVLRYRLWDIDVIIRRTLQYTLVTGVLALVYFGGVVLLQKLFSGMIREIQRFVHDCDHHPGYRRLVQSPAPAAAKFHRPALLPPKIQRRAGHCQLLEHRP